MKNKIQKITPNLWFDTQAEEAAKFYVSIFKNSAIGRITRFGKGMHNIQLDEAVMTVEFQLEGQEFVALNGGSSVRLAKKISMVYPGKLFV